MCPNRQTSWILLNIRMFLLEIIISKQYQVMNKTFHIFSSWISKIIIKPSWGLQISIPFSLYISPSCNEISLHTKVKTSRFLELLLLFLSLNPNFFLHISFSWVEIRVHTEFQLPMLLRSGSFMVGETKKGKQKKFQCN